MVKALLAVTMLGMLGATGHADPTARFGLTGAVADQSAPGKYQLGPLVAFGMRSGGFVGELEYAYLSFFDPDTTEGGVHRVGVTLRADLVREIAGLCRLRWACTRSSSIYGEVGAACRGSGSSCMSVAPTSNGLDKALFIEWMFTLGG